MTKKEKIIFELGDTSIKKLNIQLELEDFVLLSQGMETVASFASGEIDIHFNNGLIWKKFDFNLVDQLGGENEDSRSNLLLKNYPSIYCIVKQLINDNQNIIEKHLLDACNNFDKSLLTFVI